MRYPVELNIRGYRYRIEYVTQSLEVARDFESAYFYGTCDSDNLVMRIRATLPFARLLETLIHETLHALIVRNPALQLALKANVEEQFVNALAADMARLLIDSNLVHQPKRVPITTRIKPEALEREVSTQ